MQWRIKQVQSPPVSLIKIDAGPQFHRTNLLTTAKTALRPEFCGPMPLAIAGKEPGRTCLDRIKAKGHPRGRLGTRPPSH